MTTTSPAKRRSTSPVHATMLWRRIEKILHKTPPSLRSTRFAEFEARAAFVRNDVAPKAPATIRMGRSEVIKIPHYFNGLNYCKIYLVL